jgi:hypothetical protein
MGLNYIPPPPIIHQVEESRVYGKPYFYECEGCIINLAAVTRFYIDHVPLTNYYWPCAKIGGNCYKLSASMSTEKEAMEFLRNLVGKIENSSTTK